MKKEMNKIVAGIVTLSVLLILVISGPAQAYVLGLTVSNDMVEKGKTISFIVNVNIEESEKLDIDYFVLKLNGTKIVNCKFNVSGEILENCEGIKIKQSSSASYGYGYLTNGNLTFNITLDTTSYPQGLYSTEILMAVDGKEVLQEGDNFRIFLGIWVLGGCSVRAENGDLAVGENLFDTRNKLNFNIPLSKAKEDGKEGKGYFTSQSGRNRFSYKFDATKVLDNNDTNAIILINGAYKINVGERIGEEALIYLDKKNEKIDIIGNNFKVEGMKVTLMHKCRIFS